MAMFSLANLEISARSRSYTNRESISRGNYKLTTMSKGEIIKANNADKPDRRIGQGAQC